MLIVFISMIRWKISKNSLLSNNASSQVNPSERIETEGCTLDNKKLQ